jgi:hypothetical protein
LRSLLCSSCATGERKMGLDIAVCTPTSPQRNARCSGTQRSDGLRRSFAGAADGPARGLEADRQSKLGRPAEAHGARPSGGVGRDEPRRPPRRRRALPRAVPRTRVDRLRDRHNNLSVPLTVLRVLADDDRSGDDVSPSSVTPCSESVARCSERDDQDLRFVISSRSCGATVNRSPTTP